MPREIHRRRLVAAPEGDIREATAAFKLIARRLQDDRDRLKSEVAGLHRKTRELEAGKLVDAAVADGRVAADERDAWLRRFEIGDGAAFNMAASTLERLRPDPRRLLRGRQLTEEEDAVERQQIAAMYGLRVEEVH